MAEETARNGIWAWLGSLLLFGAGVAAGLAVAEGRVLIRTTPPEAKAEPPIVEQHKASAKPAAMPDVKPAKPRWNGSVEAIVEATPDGLFRATPRLVGREVRFLVQPGQLVRQDTPLLVQDHAGANARELAEKDKREALLNYSMAKRRCELAEREYNRAVQARLSVSVIDKLRVELDVARDRCDALHAQVKKAELQEEIAEFERNLKVVESPFAGIVLKVEGARGQTTPNGVAVCVLDPKVVQAPCPVPSAIAKRLKQGHTVTITPAEGRPRTARVSGASPRMNENKTFDEEHWNVWIEIRNTEAEPTIFPGERITVRFED